MTTQLVDAGKEHGSTAITSFVILPLLAMCNLSLCASVTQLLSPQSHALWHADVPMPVPRAAATAALLFHVSTASFKHMFPLLVHVSNVACSGHGNTNSSVLVLMFHCCALP